MQVCISIHLLIAIIPRKKNLTMSTTTPEEPELQNGVVPEPNSNSELEPEPQPKPSDPLPQPESQPEQEAPEPKPEPEPEAEITDADPNPEDPKPSPIQSNGSENATDKEAQISKPELRKDEGSRTFTMRELLHGLKTEETDATSPYRSAFRLTLSNSTLIRA